MCVTFIIIRYNHLAGFVRLPLHPWGSRIGSKHLIFDKNICPMISASAVRHDRKAEELTIFVRIEARASTVFQSFLTQSQFKTMYTFETSSISNSEKQG